MNKQIFSLLCLSLLAIAPACKRDKKMQTQHEQEIIETMIELDNTVVFEEESAGAKEVIKF